MDGWMQSVVAVMLPTRGGIPNTCHTVRCLHPLTLNGYDGGGGGGGGVIPLWSRSRQCTTVMAFWLDNVNLFAFAFVHYSINDVQSLINGARVQWMAGDEWMDGC